MESVSAAAPAMDGGAAPTQDASVVASSEHNDQTPHTSETKETDSVPPSEEQKYKVKVNGQELEVTLDQLLKNFSLEQASRKKMEEAAEYRKKVTEYEKQVTEYNRLMDNIQSKPELLWEFAKALNLDPHKLSEELLFQRFEYEKLTPEQRRLKELEEKERLWTEKEERAKREAAQAAEQARVEQASARIDDELGQFIETHKLDQITVDRMLGVMINSLNQGTDMTAEQAYARVKSHTEQLRNQWISSMSPEEVVSLLPKSVLEQIRKSDLAKAMSQVAPGRKLYQKPDTPSKATTPKKQTMDQMFAKLEKRYRLE